MSAPKHDGNSQALPLFSLQSSHQNIGTRTKQVNPSSNSNTQRIITRKTEQNRSFRLTREKLGTVVHMCNLNADVEPGLRASEMQVCVCVVNVHMGSEGLIGSQNRGEVVTQCPGNMLLATRVTPCRLPPSEEITPPLEGIFYETDLFSSCYLLYSFSLVLGREVKIWHILKSTISEIHTCPGK